VALGSHHRKQQKSVEDPNKYLFRQDSFEALSFLVHLTILRRKWNAPACFFEFSDESSQLVPFSRVPMTVVHATQ
jgi:hypothetical protein